MWKERKKGGYYPLFQVGKEIMMMMISGISREECRYRKCGPGGRRR